VWPASTIPKLLGIRVLIVTAPRASNPNLHAQGGLFTVERVRSTQLDDATRREPLDVVLSTYDKPNLRNGEPRLIKFGLTVAEAPKLLRLLSRLGVRKDTVYPGLAGLVAGMKEQRLWDFAPPEGSYLLV